AEIEKRMASAKLPLGKTQGVPPNQVLRKIQEVVFKARVSLIKNEEALQRALAQIAAIRDQDVPNMSAASPHDLVRLHETRNLVLCAELYLRASLERKESRECHYREDYPQTDNEHWLKWILYNKGGDGSPSVSFERVPLESYPLRPEATKA